MLLLRDIGPDGLRDRLKAERARELQSYALESIPFGEPGKVNRYTGEGQDLPRKLNALARYRVGAHQHATLLRAHAGSFYQNKSIRAEILRFINTSNNLLRMVTDRVAVAYASPPSRHLRDVSEEDTHVFMQAYREAGTDLHAEQWNRYSFYLSVVHVLPRYEDDGLRWITVLPHQCDALAEEGSNDPGILVYDTSCDGASMVAVDAERWWWLTDRFELIKEEEHKMGMRPWVTFRWQAPPDFDYWDSGSGQDLYDATMEIARVAAHKRWVRLHWSKKLQRIHLGSNVDMPENQNMAANTPVMTRGNGDVQFEVHDTIVGIDEFVAQERDIIESLCESYGLPSSALKAGSDAAYGPLHDALVKLRNKQVKHFEVAEMEMAVRVGALLRNHGYIRLTTEDIRKAFRVRFLPMTFADHPKARVETAVEQAKVGLIDYYEFYMQENPGTTYQEAKEYVDANFATMATLMESLTARNATLDPNKGFQTAAQINGMIGGEKSGVVRSEDAEDQDDDDEDTQENPS